MTEIALNPAAGYCNVHCNAAAEFPPPVNVTFNVAVPADEVVADERLMVCARNKPVDKSNMMAPITGTTFLNTQISQGATEDSPVSK